MTIDTTDCEECGTLGVSIGANCPRCGGLIPRQCNRDALTHDIDELDRINRAGDRYGHITPEVVAELIAEVRRLREDRERYQWLANRVLGADYGDNDAPGEQNGWRIVHDLLGNGDRQPAFMYGPSIDAAIDAARAKEKA